MSDSVSAAPGAPEEKLLSSYLEVLPGIVWRIDIEGNEISFLNKYSASPEGEKVRAILQNPHLAREVIMAADLETFRRSHELILRRRSTACSFRVRQKSDCQATWFKLMAMPDPIHQNCSIGILLDITAQAQAILSSTKKPRLSTRLDMIADPVLLVRFVDRTVYRANTAARLLLGYDEKTLEGVTLQNLLQSNPDKDLYTIYEGLIFADHWNGDLRVTDSQGRDHQCTARIQAIARNEENLLWMTLTHRNDCPICRGLPGRGNESPAPRFSSSSFRRCSSVRTLLGTLLKALPSGSATDAILLSRITMEKNEVAVTAVGRPFDSTPEELVHPYEGSIAESMLRFAQNNQVVPETSKSIKAIDWALFIPRGIRSYYAHPFFIEDRLAYVLIFCSTQPDTYDPDSSAPLSELYDAFLTNLERCLSPKP